MGGFTIIVLAILAAWIVRRPQKDYSLYYPVTSPCGLCQKVLTRGMLYCRSCEEATKDACPTCGALDGEPHTGLKEDDNVPAELPRHVDRSGVEDPQSSGVSAGS